MQHIFLHMTGSDQNARETIRFQCFQSLQEADAAVRDWLLKHCALSLYQDAKERRLLEEGEDGRLPENAFRCPEIAVAEDLTRYNGFHAFGSMGSISLFLFPIYDVQSAAAFQEAVIKEFSLNEIYSDAAEEAIETLRKLAQSYQEPLPLAPLTLAVERLMLQGGLPLF